MEALCLMSTGAKFRKLVGSVMNVFRDFVNNKNESRKMKNNKKCLSSSKYTVYLCKFTCP